MKYFYKKANPQEREICDIGMGHVITHEDGLYNENLTIEELSLLRELMNDYKKWQETTPWKDNFAVFIHTWMFTNQKKPRIFSDIVEDINNGVEFRKQ